MKLINDIIEITSTPAGGRRLFSAVLAAALWAVASTLSLALLAAEIGLVLSLLAAMSVTLVLEGSLIASLAVRLRKQQDTRSPEEAAEILGRALLSAVCWVPGAPAACVGLLWLVSPLTRWLGLAVAARQPALMDLVRTLGVHRSPERRERVRATSAPGSATGGEQPNEGANAPVHQKQEIQREQSESHESD